MKIKSLKQIKKSGRWLALALGGMALCGTSSVHATEPYVIYDDASPWTLKSVKGKTDLKNTQNVKNGKHSIFIDGSIAEFLAPAPVSTSGYDRIEFWAHGGTLGTGAKRYDIVVDGNPATFIRQQRYLWLVSGSWQKYSVPLSHLGNPATISSIKFLPDGWSASIYVDDIKLASGSHETFLLTPKPPEILYDGGFEEGANGQYTMRAKVESVTSPVHSGKYALRVYDRPQGPGLGWTGPDFEPTPFYHEFGAGWYEISAWFRLPDGVDRKAKCSIMTEMIYYDTQDTSHGKEKVVGKNSAEVGTEWTEVKFRVKIKTGKYAAVFKVLPVADSDTPEYFLDDVSFRKIPAPDGGDKGECANTISHIPVTASQGDISALFTISTIGKRGSGNGEFVFPRGVSCDEKGQIWVSDTDNHRVQRMDAGAQWQIFGKQGKGEGELSFPCSIATDGQDGFFLVDSGNSRIVSFSGGKWKTVHEAGAFDYAAATNKNCMIPLRTQGIAYRAKLGLLATELWFSRVLLMGDSGKWDVLNPIEKNKRAEGGGITAGISEGKVDMPRGVCADEKGNIFVADTGNHRIQMRDPQGNWKVLAGLSPETTKCFAPEGLGASSEPGKFNLPKALAVDSKGNLFVADSGNHRIQMRDAKSGAWTAFGKQGSGAGEFDGPEAIAIDAKDNIYIADTRNHRIVKLTKK